MKHPLISIDPEVMFGKPCIKGTRLPVAHVLHYLSMGYNIEEYLASFPGASREGVIAAIRYAAECMGYESSEEGAEQILQQSANKEKEI